MIKTKNKFYLAVAFVSLLAGQQATLADQHGKAAALSGDQKLAQTHWQGTTVVDLQKKDVTELNKGFIGLAKYDAASNKYEFFDKETGKSRDDIGIYFVTQDGKKRALISETKKYHAVVDLTHLDEASFVYKRSGKTGAETQGDVIVSHIPYAGELAFTTPLPVYEKSTGVIEKGKPGRDILGASLWQGTVVLDKDGKDVTAYNQGFLSLARFDGKTNQYEFFDKTTGQSRGDYGYFDVIRDNKVRTHVSIGKNYAAALELTELNDKKFTYARKGKDAQGQDIDITVEHVPYTGELKPAFTF